MAEEFVVFAPSQVVDVAAWNYDEVFSMFGAGWKYAFRRYMLPAGCGGITHVASSNVDRHHKN